MTVAHIDDLDSLPFPSSVAHLYHDLYGTERGALAGGLLAGRGCPSACTFCANVVTGRVYRRRSAANIIAEMVELYENHDIRHFPFWDDAFCVSPRHVRELCGAIRRTLPPITWSCITPAHRITADLVSTMKNSGCAAINFGIESGDTGILRSIGKGQRPEQVKHAVAAAHDCGMVTIVNFMFGFPGETRAQLEQTFQLMDELAPNTDVFNNRGVLVPFPGTRIYETYHDEFGFTDWWLNPEMVPEEPDLYALDPDEVQSLLEHDPTLDRDFFHYEDDIRDLIAEGVRFKARHNLKKIAEKSKLRSSPSSPRST